MRLLMEAEERAGRVPPVVVIISGFLGNRGATFKDKEHDLHLTHLFAGRSAAQSSGEYLVQMVSRLSGLFPSEQDPQRRSW